MALDAIIHRKRVSWLQRFREAPCWTLAKTLYAQRQRIEKERVLHGGVLGITVVCISDTHNSQPYLPPGDLLIHAGDLTQSGTAEELQSQLDWINARPHRYKMVIAGNHDIVLDERKSTEAGKGPGSRKALRWSSIVYLEHSSANLRISDGKILTVFGQPSTRKHGNWAFQYDRGTDVFTDAVDDDTDILITYSPPRFHLDVAGWGDDFLLQELWRVRPKLHVFGHIHEGYGRDVLVYDRFELLYERVCAGNAEILTLLHMVLLLFHILIAGPDRGAERTVLVNASTVGGLLDESRRKTQVVQL